MPATRLRAVQLGKETTWGTAVTATAKLMDVEDASFKFNQGLYQPEFLGTLAPGADVSEETTDWSGSITVSGTYEDLPYFLDAFFGIATPSGTAAPYTYSYTGPTTSAPTPRKCTIEYGTTGAEYKLDGGLETALTIDITQGQAWKVTSEWMGHDLNTVTMASLSDRDVNLISTGDTTVYIDSFGGTFGSTAVSATVISANIKFTNGRHLKRFLGDKAPGSWGDDKFDVEMTTVLEFNSTAKAYVDAMLSGLVNKAIRFKASDSPRSAQLDVAAYITDGVTLFDDNEGNMTVSLSWKGQYDSTNGLWFAGEIVNAVSALP